MNFIYNLTKRIIFIIFLGIAWSSCTPDIPIYLFKGNAYDLIISSKDFKFYFKNKDGTIIAPPHATSGLLFNHHQAIKWEQLNSNSINQSAEKTFIVTNSANETIQVTISFENDIAKFKIQTNKKQFTPVRLRLGGMPVAHGLGDAGAYDKSFNLVNNETNSYPITNNGSIKRWASTFVIFPKNELAGVYFDKGKKEVTTSSEEYSMGINIKEAATFYYLLGRPKTIYKNYKTLRNELGFENVKPKFRLFELGWESWDPLGWNTSEKTVKELLQKFLSEGYPIKWAVTGSGFWEKGGTTTSFGKWGEKFSTPTTFKKWMHTNDIKWMIGLRTNFIPNGGPYYPITKERDRNLKANSFTGNFLSEEANDNLYFVSQNNGDRLKITSRYFPIVPCYLLDGDAKGAAKWFGKLYKKWGVDGIKEDTMMDIDSITNIFNKPIKLIADEAGLVMARNGNFTSPGTLLRINDTRVEEIEDRIPINYFQYAASAYPNIYSDVAGVHNMKDLNSIDLSIRHTWFLSMTAGIAVGTYPEKWDKKHQAIFKKAIDFRLRLTPYFYDAAIKSYDTGFPATLTPLSIAYPKDTVVANSTNFQWMVGASLLATPLLKDYKNSAMDIYLPEGVWYDYDTAEKFIGPLLLKNFQIDLDKTPCFVGGKGILFEQINRKIYAKLYPIQNNSSTIFTHSNGLAKTQITIQNPDWENVQIIDKTIGKAISYKRAGVPFLFEIMEGHEYLVE